LVCYHESVASTNDNRGRRFFVALLIGGLIGGLVGLSIKFGLLGTSGGGARGLGEDVGDGVPAAIREGIAWQYARAYQEGNWPRVIELTLWMEERLDYVAQSGTPEDVAAERENLAAQLGTRTIAENRLNDEGVDDQYLFTPGSRLDFLSEDGGGDGLEAPVARRTWFKVTYPARDKALLDREGVPIRSVHAGISVSREGRVLKAGVIGNLDIDWNSIQYDWPAP